MNVPAVASVVLVVVVISAAGYTVYEADLNASALSSQLSTLSSNAIVFSQSITLLEKRPPITVTSTLTSTSTSILTEVSRITSVSTVTTSLYPIPSNVTVYVAPSGQFTNYAISAGSYNSSGSLGSPQSFSVSPVFQGEAITVGISISCPGSTGPTASASLYVNGTLVSHTAVACGGNTSGQISYVL